MRKSIFEAIQSARDGAVFTQTELARVDALLDSLGVPVESSPLRSYQLAKREVFYGTIQKFAGPLDEEQIDVINGLLAEASHHPLDWLAYELATAWHESRFRTTDERRERLNPELSLASTPGRTPYRRGLVHLTCHASYVKADTELRLGGRLTDNYDLALDSEIAVQIFVRGMEGGWFTGKKLATYFIKGGRHEFVAARQIVNGNDRAEMIADLATAFQDALIVGGWG